MIRNVSTTTELTTAVAAASAGDTIVLAAGTYAMGTNILTLPNGVNLFGVQTYASIITSGVTIGPNDPAMGTMVKPGSGSEIRDLSIVSSLNQVDEAHYQIPIGYIVSLGQTPFTSATLRRVYMSSYSDGVFIHGGASPAAARLALYDCYISTGYDCTRLISTSNPVWDCVVDYFKCTCESLHRDYALNDCRTHAVSSGKVRLFGGLHRSIGDAACPLSACLYTDSANGIIENYGAVIQTSNSGGSVYDADNVAGTIKMHKNSTYSAGKLNGTVSIIGGEYPAKPTTSVHRVRAA
jgi:hypothetical protein